MSVNATRQKRLECAGWIINNPEYFKPLLKIFYQANDEISVKAAWVIEFVCYEDARLIRKHLDFFINHLNSLTLDSAIRPMAKVCQLLVDTHYSKSDSNEGLRLTKAHKSTLVELCFNWLITDQKVAAKVYAMHCLLVLGQEFDWINQELILILEKDYAHQSAGFKAKARHILKALKKAN